ncbi:MAG: XrtA system polysaccharide chain length determinant [Pseudomonadota bacterium]
MLQLSELPRPVIRHVNGLWRRRWIVVAVAWFAALLGWFVLWLTPDKYESRAHVFVQTETILEPVLNGFTARPDYTERVEVMRLQLLTRPNVEEVIFRAGLDENIKARTAVERRAKLEKMIEWVAGQISIQSPRDMYFIISYKNSDPEAARAVVDAFLTMLIEQDLGASLLEDEAARRRLNLQIEQYDEKLTANERAVAEFRREHAAELTSSQGTVRLREQKDSELLRVRDELERTKGRVLTLRNLLSATPRSTSGDEIEALRIELADLRSRYEESHPDIRGVLSRINQLENRDGSVASNPEYVRLNSELSVAQDSISALELREERLQGELQTLDFAVGAAPAVEAALRQIIREYEQTQKTYDELLARRDRLDLTKNLGVAGRGVEYQVFEYPQAALAPKDPPRMLLIAAIFIIAAGAGAGVAVLMTLIDRSYAQANELQEAFGLPVLGAVSEAPSLSVLAGRRRDLQRLSGAMAGLAFVGAIYAYLSVFKLPSDIPGAAERAASVSVSGEAL